MSALQRSTRLVGRKLRNWQRERDLSPVAKMVRRERLTYLRPDRLQALEHYAARVNSERIAGDFVECGVALGGSAVVLAESMGSARVLHAYDVFGMIPPPTPEDPPEVHERYAVIAAGKSGGIGGDPYYGYRDDLEQHVVTTLDRYGYPVGDRVHLHKGLFEDTLHPTAPIALAHVDCDWHDPVAVCLWRIGEHLSTGGLIILDDYSDYGGCRAATDRYVAETPDMEFVKLESNVAVRRIRSRADPA